MQGFLFSRPVVAEELAKFVQSAPPLAAPPLQPHLGALVGG